MLDRTGYVAYPHLLIKVLQLLVDKLTTVVSDDGVGEAETADNASPDERMHLPSGDVGQVLC